MKSWHSVSTRITLTWISLTLGSLMGLFLTLDTVLKNFYVQDAKATLQQQATAFANQASSQWENTATLSELADLSAEQGQVQVIVFNTTGAVQIHGQGVPQVGKHTPPPELIRKTLTGSFGQGQLWVTTDAKYPEWLYSTAPIRRLANFQVIGAVYVAMPLHRPEHYAQEIKGLVMGMALTSATVATIAGLPVSLTITRPLQQLRRQAQRLQAGDYAARSELQGKDELAVLSRLLDQMAAKLMKTLEALQAQETARRELVANVSHDLRTPLATLRVGLEAVLDGVVKGEKAQQYLKRACRETDHLAQLVQQLLLLARADAGQLEAQPQAVSAVAIAQECLSRMEPSAVQAHINLELRAGPYIPKVWVDPELTGQVVLNLLDNAIKYAPESEVIYLEILPLIEPDQQPYVLLQVRDQGRGMEPEVIGQVTERFYRGNGARLREGLGLGLAIAQHVCRLQGGFLQINSQLDIGTVVTLFLPIATLHVET